MRDEGDRSRRVVEVADHALERGGVDGDVTVEGVVDGDGDEEQNADDRAQTGRHDHVQHGAAEAEDHGEADGHHGAHTEGDPQHAGHTLLDVVESFAPEADELVEPVGLGAEVRLLDGGVGGQLGQALGHVVEHPVDLRAARLALSHRGPLHFDHGRGVAQDVGAEVFAHIRRERLALPVDAAQRARLLADRRFGLAEVLPGDDHHEGQQHGVDHPHHRDDEARDVVVFAVREGRPRSANQQLRHDGEGGEHDHEENAGQPDWKCRHRGRLSCPPSSTNG